MWINIKWIQSKMIKLMMSSRLNRLRIIEAANRFRWACKITMNQLNQSLIITIHFIPFIIRTQLSRIPNTLLNPLFNNISMLIIRTTMFSLKRLERIRQKTIMIAATVHTLLKIEKMLDQVEVNSYLMTLSGRNNNQNPKKKLLKIT